MINYIFLLLCYMNDIAVVALLALNRHAFIMAWLDYDVHSSCDNNLKKYIVIKWPLHSKPKPEL